MRRAAIGAALAILAGPAWAFAPSVDYPPGVGNGGTTYRPDAPTPVRNGRINTGTVGVPTGGGTVRRPITWRIPPGAGKKIAGAIIRGGGYGTIASIAAWAAEKCVHFKGGGVFLKCDGPDDDFLPGELIYNNDRQPLVVHGSADAACKAAVIDQSGRKDYGHRLQQVRDGDWYCYLQYPGAHEILLTMVHKRYICRDANGRVGLRDDAKCPLPHPDGQPMTEEEAAERLSPTLPPVIPPGVETDIDQPVWNPSPYAPNKTRPVVAPIGDPVPHTEVTPEGERRTEWTQPNVTITHTPTEEEPLKFDVQPGSQRVSGPNAKPTEVDVKPATETAPEPVPGTGGTDGTNGGGTRIEIPDFCETNPEALACVKLGTTEVLDLPNVEVPLKLNPAPGFDAGGGGCPADRQMTFLGKPVVLSWRPICDFAIGIRPIILAVAAISATAAFLGLARRE